MKNPLKATTGRVITKETPGIQILKANPLTITLNMPTDSTINYKGNPHRQTAHTNAIDDCTPSDFESDHCEDEGNGHQSETSDTESKNYLAPLNASN